MTAITWTGKAGDNNYANPANWSPAQVPGVLDTVTISQTTATAINAGGGAALSLTDSKFVTLTIGNNTSFTFGSGSAASTFTNAGTLALDSGNQNTDLIVGGARLTLGGGGRIVLSDNAGNAITGGAASDQLINVNNLIDGAGQIGAGSLTLTNSAAGTILADGGNALVINTGTATITNAGLLEASGSGGLVLQSAVANTGHITAAGGNVYLQGASIQGGTLSSTGGAAIDVQSGYIGTLDGTAHAVVNTGLVAINNSGTLSLLGTITNTGQIALQSANQFTDLVIGAATGKAGTVTLSGTGSLTLSDNGNNRIYGGQAGDTLVNNATIVGAGQIGVGTLSLINAGIIDASGTNGLVVNTTSLVNTALLEATNPNGGLVLQSAVNDSNGGTLLAAGANIYLQGADVTGGLLTSTGTGAIVVQAGYSATLDGSAANVTSTGTIAINNAGTLSVLGTLSNTGLIALQSSNQNTDFIIGSPTLTLSGGGTVTLSDNSGNRIYGAAAADTLVNVNNTIVGAGQIGVGQLGLVNHGTIDASGSNYLVVNTTGVVNTALMEATNPNGGLVLQSAVNDSNGGTLLAAGANIYLQGATVTGGLLASTGAGAVVIQSSLSATLDGSASTVTNTGTIAVNNAGTLSALGTLSNTGLIALQSSNQNTDFIIGSPTLTLSGGGTVTLSDNSANRIYGAAAADTLVNVNNTIVGAGQIGASQLTLINDGTILSQGSNALILNGDTLVTNNGLLEAGSGGGLVLQSTTVANTSGTITAASSNVYLQNSTIAGGQLTAAAGQAFEIQSNYGATLDGTAAAVKLSGTVQIDNSGTLSLLGSIANNGLLHLVSGNQNTDLAIGGASGPATTVTLSGTGSVLLSDNSGNRIYGAQATDTLVLDQTLSGAGQLGVGQLVLINNSTIDATGGNALVVSTTGSTVNHGLMEATGGGGLVLDSNVDSSNGGTILAAGGNVYLNGATLIGGMLNSSGGASINVQSNVTGGLDGTKQAVTNLGTVSISNSGTLDVAGTIANKGVVALQSGNQNTDLVVSSSTLTLTGGGTLTLSDNAGNRIYGAVGTDVLNNVNNTIIGAGQLGAGQLTIVNGGIIEALGGNALVINTGSKLTNTASGQLIGAGGGGLVLQAGTYTNAGTIAADNASRVTFQSGAVLTNDSTAGVLSGGTYIADATGNGATLSVTGVAVKTDAANIVLEGAGSSILFGGTTIEASLKSIAASGRLQVLAGRAYTTANALSIAGQLTLQASVFTSHPITETATGTISGNGTLAAKLVAAGSVLATGGTLDLKGADSITGTLGGPGTVAFAGGASALNTGTVLSAGTIAVINKASLAINTNVSFAGAFNLGGGSTLSGTGTFTSSGGFGNIGAGIATVADPFVNTGTITASATGTLAFADGLANSGLIQVNGAFNDATALTGGTLSIGAGAAAAATIAGAAGAGGSTLSTLTIAGGTLNTNGTTLSVTGDYNNTAAGIGNAYNPFAGVSGTIDGQGTQLAIVGVHGTTITSVNGTETISIAPGGHAYFVVENTGPAGAAALRGALETTVNGGNITGTALTGTGVHATNYGPIAAGSSSGTFQINYSSGTLTNESIHLASDFANVPGITVDIVAAPQAPVAAIVEDRPMPAALVLNWHH